ncbi:MarR family transcriptional regulator [uncultured Tateyamaria sp.]|uniref:MarR family winged helix-turn-helix transcriptional regulator n=1 Tax=uncultured Tateyamaria sp. TaxID=455651 RepID=UPI002601E4FB|nr:MarR family transcriptional regulator [uncultured Tateyamaria sp.]
MRAEATSVSDARLRAFVGYNMKRAMNVLQADLARTLQPFGLRMLTFSTLSMIVENPGLRPSQLAEALLIERANMVVYVDQLEQAGWVTRAPNPLDRRAHALHCTEAGACVYDQARAAVEAHDRRMLDGLRADEVATVRKALGRIEVGS